MSINDFAAKLAHTPVPWWIARSISWFLAANAIITGWDYLHTPQRVAKSLTVVEKIATIHTWGYWFLGCGLVLAVGLALSRHALVWLGHFALSLLYVGFTVATFQAVYNTMNSPEGNPTGSIWRAVSQSAVITALHVILCGIRGVVPRRGDDS